MTKKLFGSSYQNKTKPLEFQVVQTIWKIVDMFIWKFITEKETPYLTWPLLYNIKNKTVQQNVKCVSSSGTEKLLCSIFFVIVIPKLTCS